MCYTIPLDSCSTRAKKVQISLIFVRVVQENGHFVYHPLYSVVICPSSLRISHHHQDDIQDETQSGYCGSSELQAAGAGEGCGVGIGATEAAVEVHRLVAATHLEDVLAV